MRGWVTALFFTFVMPYVLSHIGRTNREALLFTHRQTHTLMCKNHYINSHSIAHKAIILSLQSCLSKITCWFMASESVWQVWEPTALRKPTEILDTAAAVSRQIQKIWKRTVEIQERWREEANTNKKEWTGAKIKIFLFSSKCQFLRILWWWYNGTESGQNVLRKKNKQKQKQTYEGITWW